MTVQAPIPDFAAARRAMVDSQLRPEGVTDRAVLDAMGAVAARAIRARRQSRPLAYADRSLPLGDGRFLTAPAVLGQLLTQMAPAAGRARARGRRGHRLFGRRAGRDGLRGHRARKLAELAARAASSASTSSKAARGRPQGGAPYDLILIDGAVEYIPDAIIDQLADGGRLGAALDRPRGHAPDRRPQGRRRVRLFVDRRRRGRRAARLRAPAGVHILKGVTCVA